MDSVGKLRSTLLRIVRAVLVGLFLSAALLVAALWLFQDRLLYPGTRFAPENLAALPAGLTLLRDPHEHTSVAGYYRGPGAPRRVWVMFSGNGDNALRWDPLIEPAVNERDGFLMIEYPGYGMRAGKPSPDALLSGTEATLQALSRKLNIESPELASRIGVVGYSLGSAAALEYAAKHPVKRIILFAPFTSMLDMARRMVGSPLCNLLSDRYDNVAALRSVRTRGLPPLTILHGDHDNYIPPSMGQALAAEAPGCHFELVPGARHENVIDIGQERLRELLQEPW